MPIQLKYGFPKSKRLLKKKEFSRVHNKHSSLTHLQILISYRSNQLTGNRVGIILTRKNGPSVQRNLCKRWIRETFRTTQFQNSKAVYFDIVVRVRGSLQTVKFEHVVEAFALLHKRIQ